MCHFLQTVQQYTVTLVARDKGAPQLTNMTTITISLDDLNEFPPVFTQDVYMFSTVYTTPIGELHVPQQPLTVTVSHGNNSKTSSERSPLNRGHLYK